MLPERRGDADAVAHRLYGRCREATHADAHRLWRHLRSQRDSSSCVQFTRPRQFTRLTPHSRPIRANIQVTMQLCL